MAGNEKSGAGNETRGAGEREIVTPFSENARESSNLLSVVGDLRRNASSLSKGESPAASTFASASASASTSASANTAVDKWRGLAQACLHFDPRSSLTALDREAVMLEARTRMRDSMLEGRKRGSDLAEKTKNDIKHRLATTTDIARERAKSITIGITTNDVSTEAMKKSGRVIGMMKNAAMREGEAVV